jgi:hypothetical protein
VARARTTFDGKLQALTPVSMAARPEAGYHSAYIADQLAPVQTG